MCKAYDERESRRRRDGGRAEISGWVLATLRTLPRFRRFVGKKGQQGDAEGGVPKIRAVVVRSGADADHCSSHLAEAVLFFPLVRPV